MLEAIRENTDARATRKHYVDNSATISAACSRASVVAARAEAALQRAIDAEYEAFILAGQTPALTSADIQAKVVLFRAQLKNCTPVEKPELDFLFGMFADIARLPSPVMLRRK